MWSKGASSAPHPEMNHGARNPMKIIGIDLGTSNTYLYGAGDLPQSPPGMAQPEPVIVPGISDAAGSIATVVMYENDKPILAGNIAESEFYSNLRERPARRLASQFKPEISRREPGAIRAMTDFLRILRENLPEGTLESNTELYVGMPSLAREDFSINLGNCFMDAGWPKPAFVRESDAALVSCLQNGTLDIEDIGRKCLILDFGGGTCDYTSVESMSVLQNGGDMLYGGRLFDDLFFQAFCANDAVFAAKAPSSPYAWYVRWIECKEQKEKFSDSQSAISKNDGAEVSSKAPVLHVTWYDASGERHDSFLRDYDRDAFTRDAENYAASPAMLELLATYAHQGGLSARASELLAGKTVGLISWLREILEGVEKRYNVARVVLTGGSSRWFFTTELANRVFPAAVCSPSRRSYEDIAFGLALFPILTASREKTQKLLDEKLPAFTARAIECARKILRQQTSGIVDLCASRIVSRDIMPVLEAAQKKRMTVAELERAFSENIASDAGLLEIVREKSEIARRRIQQELNFEFRDWLKKNGVILVPRFEFPARAIGDDFLNNISVKISRLGSLNLMGFTLEKVLPVLAGTATAGAIAHGGEPVSAILGGGIAFGATWLAARTAPGMLAKRSLPSFMLTAKVRAKIAAKNKVYIEEQLAKSLGAVEAELAVDVERRLKSALVSMLTRLTVLNQVKTRQ